MPNESSSSTRKLAAILFADIAGYTALMQKDENQASVLLRRFQTELQKNVTTHHGRIVNFYGDGALCVFDIPIDAVRSAMDMQRGFATEPVVPVRVGVHSGTVTYEAEKIYGDSVNIASRIESMGVPNSILLSKKVRDEVKNNPDLQMQLLGSFDFKNVEEPLEVYAVGNEGFVVPKREELSGKFGEKETKKAKKGLQIWLPVIAFLFIASASYYFIDQLTNSLKGNPSINQKSIAVLPFTDMSPDRDQEYFSDGIMEEILNHLVKIKDLQVTSRTSSMTYKGQNKRASQIAKELGVSSILEGSVRKAGDAIRITVQFIDGETDKHLWSETYDGTLDSVFVMQSQIAQQIARELKAQISPELKERINTIPTQNMEAYRLYLEARADAEFSYDRLMEVVRLDPNFGEAWVDLARRKLFDIIITRNALPKDLDQYLLEVQELFDKGMKLSPDYAEGHLWLGAKYLWFEWNFEEAEKHHKRALELNPALPQTAYTEFLLSKGDFNEALENSYRTIEADPLSSNVWITTALVYHFLGESEKVNESITIAEGKGNNLIADGNLYRVLAFEGQYERLLDHYHKINDERANPRLLGYAGIAYYHTNRQSQVDSIIQQLKLQSKESPVGSPAFHLALIYAQMGETEAAFKWLEKAYQDREVEMYWLKVEPPFKPLYNDPRWEEMLYKVGFNVPVKG